MNSDQTPAAQEVTHAPDPAAVFGAALSLWEAANRQAVRDSLNLSECFNGMDEFMRQVMRIAEQFEAWCCRHIEFNETEDVWPYLVQDRFGVACLSNRFLKYLAGFDETDCLRVALALGLPVRYSEKLELPIDVRAPNPVPGSAFREFRIQTVRQSNDNEVIPFTANDEPYDEELGPPFFGLYGVIEDGTLEHIADRKNYTEALNLVRKLAPGLALPSAPVIGL